MIGLAQTKIDMDRMASIFAGGEVDVSFGGDDTLQDCVRLVIYPHIACVRNVICSLSVLTAWLICVCLCIQTKNAMERMAGTFAGGKVDESFGGEATTQDLVRLVIAAHIACDRDVRKSNDIVSDGDAQALAPGYLKSISALLPDIVEVLKAEPDPTSLERAGEVSYLASFSKCQT